MNQPTNEPPLYEKWIRQLKEKRIVAVVLLLSLIVSGLVNWADTFRKLMDMIRPQPVPAITAAGQQQQAPPSVQVVPTITVSPNVTVNPNVTVSPNITVSPTISIAPTNQQATTSQTATEIDSSAPSLQRPAVIGSQIHPLPKVPVAPPPTEPRQAMHTPSAPLVVAPSISKSSERTSYRTYGDLEFRLNSVRREGNDVVAEFTVSNSGQSDVQLTLFGKGSRFGYGGSSLFAFGNEYRAHSIRMSNLERTEFIGQRYFPGAPVNGTIRFNNIPSEIRALDLIRIAYSKANLRPREAFEYTSLSIE